MTPEAARSYRHHRKAVGGLLASIADGLAEFDAEQAKRPTDWGYVGTLATWRAQLQDIHDALWHLGEYAEAAR